MLILLKLFRHGEKNPSQLYPTDTHATHEWPGGLGALTPVSFVSYFKLCLHFRFR